MSAKTNVRTILGNQSKTPSKLPFTLNFAQKAQNSNCTPEQFVEELNYNPNTQINNASLNPSMGSSTCQKSSKTTEGFLSKDSDTDTQYDD